MQNVLLSLTKNTPQVVTESIYALKVAHGIAIDKVVVVTTSEEKSNIHRSLTQPRADGRGAIESLCDEYDITQIQFNETDILVPASSSGEQVRQVKTQAEMESVSQYILNVTRELTSDPETCVHASLAGGRKTMAFYLGYAMSIYARPQDTLHHVFVTEPYENTDFFYPTKSSQFIMGRTGSIDCKEADVTLAHIPFIRLRDSLPDRFLSENVSLQETQEFHELLNRPLSLNIDKRHKIIMCSGITFSLSPANFAFYLMMIDDLLDANEGFDSPKSENPEKLLALIYLNKRLELEGLPHDFDKLNDALTFSENNCLVIREAELDGLRDGIKKSFFSARKNEIGKTIRKELPEVIAEHYDIDSIEKITRSGSKKMVSYFGICLDPSLVSYRS